VSKLINHPPKLDRVWASLVLLRGRKEKPRYVAESLLPGGILEDRLPLDCPTCQQAAQQAAAQMSAAA